MPVDVISGVRGRFTIGLASTPVRVAKWTVTVKGNKISRGTFERRTKATKIGLLSAEVKVTGFWDEAENPHDLPDIRAGSVLTAEAYLIKGGFKFNFPDLAIEEVMVESDSEGDSGVLLSFTGESDGDFEYPPGDGTVDGSPAPLGRKLVPPVTPVIMGG